MDCLVIGAGVVGLAAAAALARRGIGVVVAEATAAIGSGNSSRNSEVVHGGMYYPPGSLRARHCVEGRRRLYAHCAQRGVSFRTTGKLIVATSLAEIAALQTIAARGIENGVEGLQLIDEAAARGMEPALACVGALWSPETGIVDSHGLMLALRGDIEDHGGAIAFKTQVGAIERGRSGRRWRVVLDTAPPAAMEFDAVVNSAGLDAWRVAAAIEGFPAHRVPRRVLAKGNYFAYRRRPVFQRLIYPAPVEGGLGTHVTLDLAGRMRFGPDVEWIDTPSYDVDPARASSFYASIRRYFPALPDDSLAPDYAGVRPKLTGPGEPAADFVVSGPAEHGLDGIVCLFGIESPGLTAALSLAEAIADAIEP